MYSGLAGRTASTSTANWALGAWGFLCSHRWIASLLPGLTQLLSCMAPPTTGPRPCERSGQRLLPPDVKHTNIFHYCILLCSAMSAPHPAVWRRSQRYLRQGRGRGHGCGTRSPARSPHRAASTSSRLAATSRYDVDPEARLCPYSGSIVTRRNSKHAMSFFRQGYR